MSLSRSRTCCNYKLTPFTGSYSAALVTLWEGLLGAHLCKVGAAPLLYNFAIPIPVASAFSLLLLSLIFFVCLLMTQVCQLMTLWSFRLPCNLLCNMELWRSSNKGFAGHNNNEWEIREWAILRLLKIMANSIR